MSAFLSALLNGDAFALLLVLVALAIVLYTWPTALKYAKERVDIAQLNAAAETADLEGRFAKMDVHPIALPPISIATHQTDQTIRLEQSRTAIGLDAGNRDLLTSHELIDVLQHRLMRLIDERDRESHPDKREILNIRIASLKAELNARGQQALVQITGGERLGSGDPDGDGSPGGGAKTQEDLEPVPVERNRVGF